MDGLRNCRGRQGLEYAFTVPGSSHPQPAGASCPHSAHELTDSEARFKSTVLRSMLLYLKPMLWIFPLPRLPSNPWWLFQCVCVSASLRVMWGRWGTGRCTPSQSPLFLCRDCCAQELVIWPHLCRELVRLKFSFSGGMCTGKKVRGLFLGRCGCFTNHPYCGFPCVLSVKIRIESRAGFTVWVTVNFPPWPSPTPKCYSSFHFGKWIYVQSLRAVFVSGWNLFALFC